MMDEREFHLHSDACIERMQRWAEGFDPDELDYAPGDGVITLAFGDGARFVLNRQSGNHQMWFAAGARAWHYTWDPARRAWLDDRDGHELFARIGRVVSEKLGRTVVLGA
jgi:iron donor protein CyaY